jgi:hypothetical protein
LRSVSAPAIGSAGACWLRVVSDEPQWAQGYAWTGNLDANIIADVPKPRVLDVFEWSEGDWRNQRAEVMTLVTGTPCSSTDVLRTTPELTETWWEDLRRSLRVLAKTSTVRNHADQERVSERVRSRFGDAVDSTVTRWETVHADLHWANLTRPRLGLLDWEMWGRGPVGTDAATLLCYSLLVPDVANRVRAEFTDVLDTPSGRVAQLYVIARLLRRIDGGDYPELAEPLQALAESLLRTPHADSMTIHRKSQVDSKTKD